MTKLAETQAFITSAKERFAAINSYSSHLFCQEWWKKKKAPLEEMQTFYEKPGAVYLRWVGKRHKGLQASYLPDRDEADQFLARETGLRGMVGAIAWRNGSPLLDKLYPHHFTIHETSVANMVKLIDEIMTQAEPAGKIEILTLEEVDEAQLKQRCLHVVAKLSDNPRDGLRWPRVEIWAPLSIGLPLRVRLDDFGGGPQGDYVFSDFTVDCEVDANLYALPKLKK